jgi:hypothetical protein
MSTRSRKIMFFLGEKLWLARKADSLTAISKTTL